VFPLDIPSERFITCTAIGLWSSGCHNTIHVVKKIFEPTVYPYQVQSVAILSNLYKFFMCHKNNLLNFGNAQVVSSGIFIMRSTKNQRPSTQFLSFQAKYLGILVRRVKAIIFSEFGK